MDLFLFFSEEEFLCVALAVLKFTLLPRLASNSQGSICLCFPSAEFKGVYHHTWLSLGV